jgi:hypothetical protein
MTIYFDMDGTIANLYGMDNWLELLRAYDPTPYANAKPLLNLNSLARILNRLQRKGYKIGVISWLSKCSTPDYDKAVTTAKKKWLATHLKSVRFDEIHIVGYGVPKQMFATSADDILFDDEEKNRINWTGKAFDVDNIIGILKGI